MLYAKNNDFGHAAHLLVQCESTKQWIKISEKNKNKLSLIERANNSQALVLRYSPWPIHALVYGSWIIIAELKFVENKKMCMVTKQKRCKMSKKIDIYIMHTCMHESN